MSLTRNLLGMAFASADLLAEVDENGRIVLALGAAPEGTNTEGLKGQLLAELFTPASSATIREALAAPTEGRLSLPVEIQWGPSRVRPSELKLFSMPELAPHRSCAIVYRGPAASAPARAADAAPPPLVDQDGLMEKVLAAFEGLSVQQRSLLSFTFVDLPGVEPHTAGPDGEALMGALAKLLQAASWNGASAARLTDERYALLGQPPAVDDLGGDLERLMETHGADVTPRTLSAPVPPTPDPLPTLRALRLALNGFLSNGAEGEPQVTFATALMRTMKDGERLRTIISERAFELHYQPIVDLHTGDVHHFEALTRFSEGVSPAGAIRMAEELALVVELDKAVADKAIRKLNSPGFGLIRIAVNVSANSLEGDDYVDRLLAMTADRPDVRRRLLVEVTETGALNDVAAANRRLARLRDAGIQVCIDDFGAGSASFDYLRSLSIDIVKIDGCFVKTLAEGGKETTMVRHLVELCNALDIVTIAEMVETEATAETLRGLGVHFAQGYLYGRPEKEPRLRRPQKPAKRMGMAEGWG
ncbi:MAG: EAL domain-containing protein [Brevundimonas sp.]